MKTASEIRVLHVDDDKCFLTIAKAILSSEGPFTIETATSAEEALTKLHNGTVDVIISDYEMPQKNGLELFKLIRENGFATPFILFTGKGREEIVVQALNIGVDRYISKQGNPQTVYTELSVTIKQLYDKSNGQKMLWESEERFKRMVTNSKDLTMLTGTDGIILYVSPSSKEILGYEPDELIGKAPWVVHPEDTEQIKKIFQNALTTPINGSTEYRIITKQGETKWVNHSFSQIIENSKIKQVVSSIRDITESKNYQAKLLESEERFRLVIENSPIMMANMNRDLQYTWVHNPLIIQQNQENILGKKFGEAVEIEDFQEIRKSLLELLNTGGFHRREIAIHVNNENLFLECYFEATKNQKGEVTGISYTAYEITQRKKMENQLASLEERWYFALEGADDGVWDWNTQTNEVFFSAKWKKMLGYEENEFKNSFDQWFNRIHPNDKQRLMDEIERHLTGETPIFVKEYRLLAKNGFYKWVLSRGKVVSRNTDGKALRVIGTQTDITERQKADKALKESEEKFYAAFTSSGAAIAITRLTDGMFIEANDYFFETFGYTREEVIGKTPHELNLYADTEMRQKIVTQTLNNQPVINREIKFLRKDKTEITGLFSTKIVNIKGHMHLLTTLIDITELKKTEKALFLRQKELENFLAIAPDAVAIIDMNGKIIEGNELSWKTFGYTREEVIGADGAKFVVEEDRQKLTNEMGKALHDKQTHTSTFTGKNRNGEDICLESSVKAIFDQQGNPTGLIAIIRDITARKLTERKLQESEERYRFVAEHAQDLITVTDKTGMLNYVSPSIIHLAGFTPDELVGKNIFDYLTQEDKQIIRTNSRRLIENEETTPIEIRFLTKKGTYIWLEASISTVKDANGTNRFISISREVTQSRIDREERNIALHKAELLLNKLSVVGGFVRHDVRNKLSVIAGILYISKKYSNGNPFMQKQMEQISYSVENIARILDFSQTYEAAGARGLSWVNVNKSFEEAKILCPDLNIIKMEIENVNFEVLADSALVEIFHNLIDNSIKYGKDLSKIRIYSLKTEKGTIQIIYEDNGGGIDPEIKKRLFQKGAGKGTGLGLYLIQRICEIFDWQINENGEQGKGVRFELDIPKELTRNFAN